jgi:hypothetical protein
MPESEYRGRSLAFIRNLLECPARWGSAKDAAEAMAEQRRTGYPMVLGAVCFYDMEPWGDIGLHVGNGEVLRIIQGRPQLVPVMRDLNYIGWVTTGEFREASGAEAPVVR